MLGPVLSTIVHPESVSFSATAGQGWTQITELLIAFVLSMSIGFERQMQQKSAGLRTYTLVGLGSALFMLISKYGFSDVLGENVTLDPSRVAAQVVSGLGFIGGGLIFLRRDTVRGLTTAASIWLTAAVGSAAGAGLPILAALSCALYFLLMYGIRPLTRLAERFRPHVFALRVQYEDGRGLLRSVVDLVTSHGFSVEELATSTADERGERERRPTVEVTLVLAGRGNLGELTARLYDVEGVLAVRTGRGLEE